MKKQFKNETRYIRSPNDGVDGNFYTKINNNLINDGRINFLHLGIMTYILSQSDEFIINKATIFKMASTPKEDSGSKVVFGKTIFDRTWNELIDFGYLRKERIKGGVRWVVVEDPY